MERFARVSALTVLKIWSVASEPGSRMEFMKASVSEVMASVKDTILAGGGRPVVISGWVVMWCCVVVSCVSREGRLCLVY